VVIDVSSNLYKSMPPARFLVVVTDGLLVPTTSPVLPTLPIMLDELNETRDLYAFIKQVRQAFELQVVHVR
jgi:hypothetical protein